MVGDSRYPSISAAKSLSLRECGDILRIYSTLQIMPKGIKEPLTIYEVGGRRDSLQNIHGGLKYLQQMYNEFGNWSLALAAYNAGPGNVKKYGGIPPFAETQKYVAGILGAGKGQQGTGQRQ